MTAQLETPREGVMRTAASLPSVCVACCVVNDQPVGNPKRKV
jgi:hypothetical protein